MPAMDTSERVVEVMFGVHGVVVPGFTKMISPVAGSCMLVASVCFFCVKALTVEMVFAGACTWACAAGAGVATVCTPVTAHALASATASVRVEMWCCMVGVLDS